MTEHRERWDLPAYAQIVGARRDDDLLHVTFGNGDEVALSLSALGLGRGVELQVDDDGSLLARDGGEEREIDWMVVRSHTDSEFAEELRRRDAEEARRVGNRLRVLRENRGIKQLAAAKMAGMSPPQLSKLERGETDMRLSTIRSLLRALDGSFADITGPDAPEVSVRELTKRAAKAGAPKGILERIAARVNPAQLANTFAYAFDWDPNALLSGVPEATPLDFSVSFKARSPEKAKSSALLRFARTLSEVSAEAFGEPILALPASGAEIRAQAAAESGEVSLPSLVQWAWNAGVIVMPMSGPGFSAAAWHVETRPVIVLKASQDYSAHWLFELAHEIGHLALGHARGSEGVVDIDQPQPGGDTDTQEKEANAFALEMLVPDRQRLLKEIRRGSGAPLKRQKERFKWEVVRVADEVGVSRGLLGFVAAYALTDVAEVGDRWGSATNLAKEEEPARATVRAAYSDRIDFEDVAERDRALLQVAVLE